VARILIGLGLALVFAGLLVAGFERLAGAPGRGLPGDLTIRWGSVTLYLPIATCLLVSLILSAVFFLLGVVGRR
jgi:DUF2905 family protein